MPDERGAMAMVASEQALPAFQQAAVGKMPCRARFYVEMKPGETTFVSWKKLIKDFHRTAPPSDPPPGAHPALQARIAPEVVLQKDPLPPPPNRFNSVIEKIERIYKGDDSTDENDTLNDFPDDDQYDTADSFIDDRELNEYFSVDKAKLKHEGFFVNRGKLERETEAAASPVAAPKKRKRRDIKKLSLEANEDVSKNLLNTAVRLKAAARKSPLSAVGLSDSSDKEFFALSAPNKQATQKRRKEALDSLPRHEAGKGTERSIYEHDHVDTRVYGSVVSQNAKDTAKELTGHRQVWKGDAAERSEDQSSTVNMAELQLAENFDSNSSLKRDDFRELEQKEAAVSNPIKVKSVQKSAKDEDSREVMGVAGRLQLGNVILSPPVGKEVSPVRSKGTALERAFQDLERGVAQLCPPSLVVREPEQGKRNRLSQDIKQKLAKVARLAAKQGRLTDELIDRLMGILGHVMRVKTLKRNLKEMIENGKSAMQEKEGRLQDIKREVTEMVKSRVHSLQAQDVEQREFSSDDFQPLGGFAEKPSSEGRYQWDHATEDKICDLYEQYIEGMDEHKGPQIRKLYGELAELWPDGWMDNNGIKHAVQRAKERKKKQSKASNVRAESRKRQRSSAKQIESDVERFPLLDLNLPGRDHSSYEKVRSNIVLQPELDLNVKSEVAYSSGVKNHHLLKKSIGKGFGSVEKKRSKMEGNPSLKKKVKRKLEKGAIDTAVLSSHGKLMTFENPFWKMGIQPLVALPARPLQQRHFLQQSEASAAEHIN